MSNESEERKPLLKYSETQERATLVDTEEEESMSPRRRKSGKRKKGSKRRGVRVNKGKLAIRIAGYQGSPHFSASELIHFIPLSKLKAAARKVLKRSGRDLKKKRKGKRKGRRR